MESKRNPLRRAAMPAASLVTLLLAPAAGAQTAASVTVNCANNLGAYNRMEQYTNINLSGTSQFSNEVADDEYLHGKNMDPVIARIFISPNTIKANGISFYDNHLAEVSRYAGSILVAVSAPPTDGSMTSAQYRTYLQQILAHYKGAYPKIQFIEAVNEPDLAGMSSSTYYNTYYKMFYQEINNYNAAHSGANLAVGGPVNSAWDPDRIRDFINNYSADTDTTKRLDFLSYHDYVRDRNYDSSSLKPGTFTNLRIKDTNYLADYAHRRHDIDAWLAAAGLSTNIPVWATESGIFPGSERTTSAAYSGIGDAQVLTMQAASVATMNYYYVANGSEPGGNSIYPFAWALRLYSGAEKSMVDPTTTNHFSPMGNLMFALNQMPSNRVGAVTTSGFDTLNGWGVQVLASSDNGSLVNALVWNWQQRNTTSYTVTVTFQNLPGGFSGHTVSPHLYLIDTTHSNYVYDPSNAFLQDVTSTKLTVGANNTYTFTLEPNAIARIKLQPGS